MGFRTGNRVSEEIAVRKLYFQPTSNRRRPNDSNPALAEKLRGNKNF
jgi:hypothetical protein